MSDRLDRIFLSEMKERQLQTGSDASVRPPASFFPYLLNIYYFFLETGYHELALALDAGK